MTFSCEAGKKNKQRARISDQYFQYIRSIADKESGSVFLPGNFLNWDPIEKIETIAMTARPLRLDHTLWDRTPAWKVVKSYDHYVCLFIVNDELDGSHKNDYFQTMRKLGMISMDKSANVK